MGTDVIELTSAPALGKLYVKAVAASRGRKDKGGLPEVKVVRKGVTIDPAALADYDHVCGYAVREQVPATYLHNLVFPLQVTLFNHPKYPYPMVGSVHLDNTLTVHRPVTLDETFDLSTWATNARPHKAGVQVDVISQAHVGDQLVWEGLATYLYRGRRVEGEVPARPPQEQAPDGAGMIWRLPGDLGRRFSSVSGDVNPIHMHPLSAKAMGFPSAIAHGMWSQAAMLAAIENRLPESYVATMSFRKPVLIPGTVRLVARQGGQEGSWELVLRNNRKGTELVRGDVRPIS